MGRDKEGQRGGSMTDKLHQLHYDISHKLNEIASLFKDGVALKITLLLRTPELPDGGVLMTSDDLDAAISEINRLRVKEPVQP
jgi:hypothetical protein